MMTEEKQSEDANPILSSSPSAIKSIHWSSFVESWKRQQRVPTFLKLSSSLLKTIAFYKLFKDQKDQVYNERNHL